MGKVIIHSDTTQNPITLIGKYSGICYGSNTEDDEKNYKRGLDNIESNHGRALENVQIYFSTKGYSAKFDREYYTHLAGAPTRMQQSTRYIDYQHGFKYITPPSIGRLPSACEIYDDLMNDIVIALNKLDQLGIPREDSSMLLPLGMESDIVVRTNLRNLIDMSRQRMCNRAFWEYRQFMKDLCNALSEVSTEWKQLVDTLFYAKCEENQVCPEKNGCGKYARRTN